MSFRIIREDSYNTARKIDSSKGYDHRGNADKTEGNTVNAFQLLPVSGTVLISHDRADPNGKTQVKGIEQKLSVQQDRDGSYTIRTCQTHQDDVEQKGDHGIGKLVYHFRGTVVAGLDQFFYVHGEVSQMKSMLLIQEKDQSCQGRYPGQLRQCQDRRIR